MGRNYSNTTIKVLFALSGNQCAHPNCKNALIEPATEVSDALVSGQICHIYAINPDGPRGKGGLTDSELNAPENLILLCPYHHRVVDGQHETYPAEKLRKWKQRHETVMQERLSANIDSVPPDILSNSYFPKELVDQKIEAEVWKLRKARFFAEYDTVRSSLTLGKKITQGELSGGTDAIKCQGLAWCSRLLSRSEAVNKSEEFLKLAQQLGDCQEIDVAQSFVCSQKDGKSAGLKALGKIDTASLRSAALFVVSHHEDAEAAIKWLGKAGLNASDLSPEGRYLLLSLHVKLDQWNAAREVVDSLSDQDLNEAPVLKHIAAMTQLLVAIPDEYHRVVLNQIPFEAAKFPLAENDLGINARRAAYRYFRDAAKEAHLLGCPEAAMVDEEYALWLQLRDPKTSDEGRRLLEQKLCDAKSALPLVHLGLQFGVKVDVASIEMYIEQEIALNGRTTRGAALARFALAFTKKSPEEVGNYVEEHYDDLVEQFNKKDLLSLQVEMFSKAGQPKRAKDTFESLLEDGLTEDEESRLHRVIAEAEGADPIVVRRNQFEKSDSLSDLGSLVDILEDRQDWDNLCDFAEILHKRTRSLQDAIRLATALSNAHNSAKLIEFLHPVPNLLARSRHLRMLYAWALYYEGALVEARSELERLSDDSDDPNYLNLHLNLGVALGDLDSLNAYIANEYENRDKRSALDLINAAQLAVQIGAPHAKDFVFLAAMKGDDDALVLACAYDLATIAGWEDDERVSHWLTKAAELSGDEGPLQRVSFKEIVERKPDWERQESEVGRMLESGEIPLFLAARSLNKSLINLTLFPALSNQAEPDPRQTILIPAYSGTRQSVRFDFADVTIGMDTTALLTLGFLNLLDESLCAFKEIFVPHSTLKWILDEKQRATFHQPSRIRHAHQLRILLASGVLEEFVPTAVANSDLAAQVGDVLASLIATAEKARGEDTIQSFVVCSSPVYRLSSHMVDEVDLTAFANTLISCTAVVDKLRKKGQLTAEELKKAHSYFQLHEKPWPNQPEIPDRARLYLSDLTITYFLHLGILDKLKPAGFTTIASHREVAEANSLIAYEHISEQVEATIERIRSTLNSGIKCGTIKVGRKLQADESDGPLISENPTVEVIGLASKCDLILSDDRFLNQYDNVGEGKSKTPIASTLDLLDAMANSGELSIEERLEHRTLLRRAGYSLIPVDHEELTRHLVASEVVNGQVREIAELKAIRENILSVRMGNLLQLPKETMWLDNTFTSFFRVLKSLWVEGAELAGIVVRSNWLVDQLDIRGWAHSFGTEAGESIVSHGRGAYIQVLFTPPISVSQEFREEYLEWTESRVLAPIQEQFPELYAKMVELQKNLIAEIAEMNLNGTRNDE